jgi:D-psicose/D-tagatose/L-ribulose 3-epimerase
MKLAISNIAWTEREEPAVAALLQRLGVRFVEIAPTKKWDDLTKQVSAEEVAAYKDFWKGYGIEIVAFQSMLFKRPDLKIFESDNNRQATQEYLHKFIELAGDFGAGVMVFGSPRNRKRDNLSKKEATRLSIPFFEQLGGAASVYQTKFCIEPNAPQYDCDFITTAQEGIDLVKAVNNPGFRLHLDIACMTLAGDRVGDSIKSAADYLQHFHISSPMLEQVENRQDVNHVEAAAALRDIGYKGFTSIEMRPGNPDENIMRVEKAVQFVQQVYNS